MVAAGCGFAAGAYWGKIIVPAAPQPPPTVVLARQLLIPAANHTPAFAAPAWAYWYSGYAGQPLTVPYSAPFPVDACLYDWPGGTPSLQDNFTECSSQAGAHLRMNESSGVLGFTVPSQPDSGFVFYVLDPAGVGGRVNYSWYINSTSGTYITGGYPSNITLPPGQLVSPFVLNLSVPLPAGYTSVTVSGISTGPVQPTFFLKPFNGWTPGGNSWNWAGAYEGPEDMQVRISTSLFLPVTVSLVVVVSDG